MKQVIENKESTQRQYALNNRALALGLRLDHIIVIDDDLGLSGTSTQDRKGFQDEEESYKWESSDPEYSAGSVESYHTRSL